MNMSLVLRHGKCIFADPLQMSHACHRFWMLQNPHVLLTFDKVHNPLHLPRETTSERPKVVRTPGVFNVLTSKCASRHNGMHFFNISTSKSKNRKTHWYEAVSSALNFPFLKEVSQNCFVFDVVNSKK